MADLAINQLSNYSGPLLQTNVIPVVQLPGASPIAARKAPLSAILSDIVQKTNNATGWSLSGGATNKTLTFLENSTINQNLSSAASVVFAGLNATSPSNANARIELSYDLANVCGLVQSNYNGAGLTELKLNPLGNSVSVNLAANVGAQSPLHVEADMFLSNTTTPPIPTLGGKLYSKLTAGNSDLYYFDSSGIEHQITSTASTVGTWEIAPSSTYLRPIPALGMTGILLYNAGASFNTKISYETNGIYYDCSDINQIHRFWQRLQAESSIKISNSGTLTRGKGLSLFTGSDDYKIGFDDVGGSVGYIRYNVDTADSIHGHIFSAGALGSATTLATLSGLGQLSVIKNDGWLAGVFGGAATNKAVLGSLTGEATIAAQNSSLTGFVDLTIQNSAANLIIAAGNTTFNGTISSSAAGAASLIVSANPLVVNSQNAGSGAVNWIASGFGGQAGDKVVTGNLYGRATIGAHTQTFSAWKNLHIQPTLAANVGICLDPTTQSANANLHAFGSTILGCPSTVMPDANMYGSQISPSVNQTTNVLSFKVKKSDGTVVSFPMGLSVRSITANTTNLASDDIVCIDTTLGAVNFTVDVSILRRPLAILFFQGAGACSFQALGGQFIHGFSTPISLGAVYSTATILPTTSSINGFISSSATYQTVGTI